MVTMAQSAANWHNMHTHVDRTHPLTHLHQYSYIHAVRSASSASAEFWNLFFILKVPGFHVVANNTRLFIHSLFYKNK